jgi:hypothetical protein
MNRLQVAQRIVGEVSEHESIVPKRHYLMLQWLRREIEAELLKRDERAAEIAKQMPPLRSYHKDVDEGYEIACDLIATAILKEDE